ncbi:MAG: glycosyltransferase family 2 protein [Candidatus Sumerlaeota bacterium]|nr:glycosyltransferase family 2 protein [Candidatus Sumerlaeota bacterium]
MPRLSVVIPCRNGAADLRRCLTALRAEVNPDLEILVVDDASTDETLSVARELADKPLSLPRQRGPAAARNHGAAHASGEILWFLDADVEIHPGASRLIETFLRDHPEADAVIGSYDEEPAAPGACSQFKNLFHHFVHQQARGAVSSFWAGCGAVRRSAFEAAGGFDAAAYPRPMIEDIHLGYRMTLAGRRIEALAPLQVRHYKRWTLGALVYTDLFHRAAPWTVAMLRNRGCGAGELNLGGAYRASIVAVYLALLAAAAGFGFAPLWLGVPVCLAAVLLFNRSLLGFFRRKRGTAFLLQTIPLLWLYFLYCGAGFAVGVAQYVWGLLARGAPTSST